MKNNILKKIGPDKITNLLYSLELKPFDMVIILDKNIQGYQYYSGNTKEYNLSYYGSSESTFASENEGILSEVAIFEFLDKCLMS